MKKILLPAIVLLLLLVPTVAAQDNISFNWDDTDNLNMEVGETRNIDITVEITSGFAYDDVWIGMDNIGYDNVNNVEVGRTTGAMREECMAKLTYYDYGSLGPDNITESFPVSAVSDGEFGKDNVMIFGEKREPILVVDVLAINETTAENATFSDNRNADGTISTSSSGGGSTSDDDGGLFSSFFDLISGLFPF